MLLLELLAVSNRKTKVPEQKLEASMETKFYITAASALMRRSKGAPSKRILSVPRAQLDSCKCSYTTITTITKLRISDISFLRQNKTVSKHASTQTYTKCFAVKPSRFRYIKLLAQELFFFFNFSTPVYKI